MLNKIIFLLAFATVGLGNACLHGQDTLRTYIFGHSLINHELQVNPTPSNETSVPHWFHFLAREANQRYEVAGQYGFIPQHANLPPVAQWGFDSVPPAWDDWLETFAEADFDNILITPGNFIQWQGPSVNYYNDNQSPLDYTNQIFNWVNQQEDSLTLYIYENWPDMAPYLANGFPPAQSEWNTYNNYLNGAFHDWFIEYHDSLIDAHPNHCVRMIPTGPAISSLLSQPPFNTIAIDTLYEDDAPHGRPTIYFLAALTTYMAMYETPAPLSYQPPAIIDPVVTSNYSMAVNYLWNYLLNFNDLNGDSRVFCNPSGPLAIEENEPGSIFEEEIQPELQAYPNPTNGLLNIRTNFETYDAVVMDLQGRSLRVVSGSPQSIALDGLADGLYLLRVRNPQTGTTVTQKILKKGGW